MSNSIHILTSYKGGVGKTSIALSIANHCVQHGINFTLIDTNPQNSNLAEDIFFYFHVEQMLKGKAGISKNGTVYTLSPDSDVTFTVLDATNQDPFEVAHHIQKTSTNEDHVYIIDTNVHIRSCCKEEISGKNGTHNVFVWFLWGWSSPRLNHQLQTILDAVKRIEISWPKAQVVHVFNLYDFYSSGLQMFSLRKASTTIRPLKKVLKHINKRIKQFNNKKCKAVYVDINFIGNTMSELHETLVRYVAPDNRTMKELPILWASHLMDLMKLTKHRYPYNVLLIPTFFQELTMSVDRIVMSAPRRFDKLIELIKPMAEYIGIFLSSLNHCLEPEQASKVIYEA
jgi:hypothetical protein